MSAGVEQGGRNLSEVGILPGLPEVARSSQPWASHLGPLRGILDPSTATSLEQTYESSSLFAL